jgi:hypothetical protein
MLIRVLSAVFLLPLAIESEAVSYDRKDFNYRSYKPNTSIGFYTGKTCEFINIDHVVAFSFETLHTSNLLRMRAIST